MEPQEACGTLIIGCDLVYIASGSFQICSKVQSNDLNGKFLNRKLTVAVKKFAVKSCKVSNRKVAGGVLKMCSKVLQSDVLNRKVLNRNLLVAV